MQRSNANYFSYIRKERMSRLIDQQKNYSADFGAIFRSSAIFFKPLNIKTTVSISNYWKFKNDIDVGIVISYRNLKGKLIAREQPSFSTGHVLNIEVTHIEEGSVEIEAYSHKNLRIPYAAIMCIYETKGSISMVHSYGRNHSLIELEDNSSITQARESCWTLRPSKDIRNLAVFHNGHVPLEEQFAKFIVSTLLGSEKIINFSIPALQAYESFIFDAEEIFPELYDFLEGGLGFGTLHFESESSFTRLLVLWIDKVSNNIQVTHSNFDYSSHQTNILGETDTAYMELPSVRGRIPEVIVYPKFSEGSYVVNDQYKFDSAIQISAENSRLSISRDDRKLPSRIVTAITDKISDEAILPYECSLGVLHQKRPPKRFHWFVASSDYLSTIHITSYEKIYPCDGAIELVCRMYSEASHFIDEKILRFDSLGSVTKEIDVGSIFNLEDVKGYFYVSIFSAYGGLFIFSSIQKDNCLTIEHSF